MDFRLIHLVSLNCQQLPATAEYVIVARYKSQGVGTFVKVSIPAAISLGITWRLLILLDGFFLILIVKSIHHIIMFNLHSILLINPL